MSTEIAGRSRYPGRRSGMRAPLRFRSRVVPTGSFESGDGGENFDHGPDDDQIEKHLVSDQDAGLVRGTMSPNTTVENTSIVKYRARVWSRCW